MQKLIGTIFFLIFINCDFSLFSQDFKTVPDMLNKQIKHSQIKKSTLEKFL